MNTFKVDIEEQPYCKDPFALFMTHTQGNPNSILLESADVASKDSLASRSIIASALRITAKDHAVIYEALTENGASLLPKIAALLQGKTTHITIEEEKMTAYFPTQIEEEFTEDERLKMPSVLDGLRVFITLAEKEMESPKMLFLAGIFAYELVAQFEPIPCHDERVREMPDFCFYLAERYCVIDHIAKTTEVISIQFGEALLTHTKSKSSPPISSPMKETLTTVTPALSDEDFISQVANLKQYIEAGDVFQIVPSRKFHLKCENALNAYQTLKKTNPSPYLFYMKDSEFEVFGASPESALKYTKETHDVEIYPIAGTRPRGLNLDGSINNDLDSRLELSLRTDQKELAEHIMLIDLARNDVAKISQTGTRHVIDLAKVDRYAFVMHLVSRVVGKLREDLDALHAYQSAMNMGTLTGAPKIRAMQLIAQHENSPRGAYGGAIGYLKGDGTLDTCIVIRSAFVKNGIATVQAGAGVVKHSDPISEMEETKSKARAVIRAILASQHSSEVF